MSNHQQQGENDGDQPPHAACIVAIGASAGGLEAIRAFFQAMPADSGMAFVIIQHLAPDQVSLTAEIIGRNTAMPTVQAADGMPVEANHIYAIPPNSELAIRDGILRVSQGRAMDASRGGMPSPIDHFFMSLGRDQHERAIGIILSGSGSDGSVGLKSIAENGGIILVQKPETAQFTAMPNAAIRTGLVQHVLTVAEMPKVLIGYARHPYVVRAADMAVSGGATVEDILDIVAERCHYSFSGYRRSTLVRRIERRLGLHSLDWQAYADLLRRDAAETRELFADLLISVTEFFRDAPAWDALAQAAIAPLVAEKKNSDPIRIWVPGCATGEEAYSIGIVLLEQLELAGKRCPVQIFATDVNEEALALGRVGQYPWGIAAQVSEARRQRFFMPREDSHAYQVAQQLREIVVFGRHNLLADPPFSRLDLVSCRNTLIYFEPEVQRELISLFHFSLTPGGWLFLGTAETVAQHEDVFQSVSKKWRLYRHIGGRTAARLTLPVTHGQHPRLLPLPPAKASPSAIAGAAQRIILERFSAAAVMVNARYEALYYSGATERYLRQPPGAPTADLLSQLREGLRSRLRSALREAAMTKSSVAVTDARVKRDEGYVPVRLTIVPTSPEGEGASLFLIVFEDQPPPRGQIELPESALVRQLEEELAATKADLQSSLERTDASLADVQVVNEELRSANEELATVNQQLEIKVHELEIANSDLKNLLAGSDIITICVDGEKRIKWFSPALKRFCSLLPGDLGRPLTDFWLAAMGERLLEDVDEVLANGRAVTHEVLTDQGQWYARRIVPYSDEQGTVAGALITYADITDSKRLSEAALAVERQTVEQRTAQLAQLTAQLSLAEEKERRVLGQSLHDNLSQVLAIMRIKLAALQKEERRGRLQAALQEIVGLLDSVNLSVRAIAAELSPPVLRTLGLVAALEWLAEELGRSFGLKVAFHDDGAEKPLGEPALTTVFRAVRELLVNVVKHSGRQEAEVVCARARDRLLITVTDRGEGFKPQNVFSQSSGSLNLGLLGMRERIGILGGEILVDSAPGAGTSVSLSVPLSAAPR